MRKLLILPLLVVLVLGAHALVADEPNPDNPCPTDAEACARWATHECSDQGGVQSVHFALLDMSDRVSCSYQCQDPNWLGLRPWENCTGPRPAPPSGSCCDTDTCECGPCPCPEGTE